MGPLTSLEIIVGSPRNSEWKFIDRVWLIQTIQANVEDVEHVDGALSAATFAPRLTAPPKRPVGIRQIARRTLIDSRLRKNRQRFVEQRLLADDDKWELWRITARISEFRRIEYDELEQQLQARIQPILASQGLTSNQVQVRYTGGIPVLFAAQRELLESLFFSFGLAVALIPAVMMIVLRSLTAGLLAMIPNVFPALATFGIMGWTGSLVDVGAMMTASIGLGIAVDDTMHFLTWYRRALQQGASPRDAVMTSFRRCAAAMVHTTLIAGLGLLVFAFSTFQPVSQFGLLMFSLLTAALKSWLELGDDVSRFLVAVLGRLEILVELSV